MADSFLNKTMLEVAIQIATIAHLGHKDRYGKPYIMHPLRIAVAVEHFSEEYQITAILHDILEHTDHPPKMESMLNVTFSENVIKAVNILTHDKVDSYDEYIDKIISCASIEAGVIALHIKKADLEDNIRHLEEHNDIESYRILSEKYCIALQKIEAILEKQSI